MGDHQAPAHRKRMVRVERVQQARYLTFSNHNRWPLMGNAAIRDVFAETLTQARERNGFRLIAWVAMPEHAHLLIAPPVGEASIVKSLWWIKRESARRVIARWRELDAPILERLRDGHGRVRFWQRGGGYDRTVWTEQSLREKRRYIHLNPVRRGLVKQPDEWRWSSARWYAGNHADTPPIDDPF